VKGVVETREPAEWLEAFRRLSSSMTKQSTELQLEISKLGTFAKQWKQRLCYAYVETVDGEYLGTTLDNAMRLWARYCVADLSEVVRVGRVG
jgi:hypothetical protein